MKYALMFNVLKDGEIEPINWSKEIFIPDRSIILLEELTPAVWLWHGTKRSLVDRRIASRQAESIKGYGYNVKDTIIGRRTRIIKEIDQRKIGKDNETDKLYKEFKDILNKEINPIDKIIVSFQFDETEFNKIKIKTNAIQQTTDLKEIKSNSESISKKLPEKRLESTVQKNISNIKQEAQIKTTSSQSIRISNPPIPIKKQEFTFEAQIKEVGSYQTAELINDLLNRIERVELKLDGLIKEFKAFKESMNIK